MAQVAVQIHPIKAFNDNYIWAICPSDSNLMWVVDPGQSEPVIEFATTQQKQLVGILVTHHHWDHTDGIAPLRTHYGELPVYGPKNTPFNGITHPLNDGDKIKIAGLNFTITHTPGHTLDHICYLTPELAFTGDTLFSAGCGRLFEGSPQQMWHSLQTLAQLPPHCEIYCTHEYTQANLAFAAAVEPENDDITQWQQWGEQQRAQAQPTLPTTIARELSINPFIRANLPHMLNTLPADMQTECSEDWQRFAVLRRWKDNF
ncbi:MULTISPECIES: hydroxyacylglutathione hydrolase [unclassified Pseudoalteromonas]|uniref:hydroxyacylglutathione hydrolase n=1 Tax=unclassified Pseudoalteromonas TaxID=194690 RepID=UPI00209771D8|nr:hydroxyacylglutathione hydrolase [Pseudoalteromonas sp. XMcav2-N]MCO7189653.1 hydroxyacylglutathione hydrolase [Pseudoalteromonas sp. XMcav2-N]